MGNPISNFIQQQEDAKIDEDKERSNEAISLLGTLATNKISAQKAEIEQEIMQNGKIIAICPIMELQDVSIVVGKSSTLADQIDGIVDNLFSGKFVDAIKNAVKCGIDAMLKDSFTGSEKEHKDFIMTFENASLVRCDFYVYRYSFSSENGLGKYCESVIAYWCRKTICSDQKSDPQVILYFLTQLVSRSQKVDNIVQELKDDVTIANELMKVLELIGERQQKPIVNDSK